MSKPYASSVQEVLLKFQTSEKGLSDDEVKKRLQKYGRNVLEEKRRSKIAIFFAQFHNILIYILMLASLVTAFAGKWTDFTAIVFMILLNGIIGFVEEVRAEASIEALKKMTETREHVIRNGSIVKVFSSDIVPGDIIKFNEGDAVTADIRLVDSNALFMDESSLTGESLPVDKDSNAVFDENTQPFDQKNMLFSGTSVVKGEGLGIVVATGKQSYFAKIVYAGK
nr:HAD-IC family P-type ATPase [Chlamydiales bacterium]